MEEIRIDEVIRSKRKTVALIVTPDARLIVRAPAGTPLIYIKSLADRKGPWIRKKMLELSERPKRRSKAFVEGEEFLFLGRPYRLCIVDSQRDIELRDRLLLSERALPQAREILKQWYGHAALEIIRERCGRYQDIVGCRPASIKITGAGKRWGSCGRKGTLNFSWRLAMAPLEVIDYLVVHELAHIGMLNHSPAYWSRVRGVLPDYRLREKWLRENDSLLHI